MPATTGDGGMTWQFPFRPNIYTALFTTTDPNMTGNQSAATLTDTITVNGPATALMTQHDGGAGCSSNLPATVRFFFMLPSASGPRAPPPCPPVYCVPPACLFTHFWWSHPIFL